MQAVLKFIYVFCLFVVLVGGTNWIVTAINSWENDDESVPDLLQTQVGLSSSTSNWIYLVVFICTIVLVFIDSFKLFTEKKPPVAGLTGNFGLNRFNLF